MLRRYRAARAPEAETAGRLAVTEVPFAAPTDSVGRVRELLRSDGHRAVDLIFVVDGEGLYRGVAPLANVLCATDDAPIGALVEADWPSVAPDLDQEHAVERACDAGVSVLPVVAADGRPVGVLTPDILLTVLTREHHEDVNRIVGILKDRAGARQALEDPPLRRVALRLPWLLVGLGMSAAATAVMASYEDALRSNVLIAVFIPALVYITDAIGTQTEAIAVRGLSLGQRPLPAIFGFEILTGALIGLALGALALLGIWVVFGDFTVGAGVGLSVFFAGTIASSVGLALPWMLDKAGIDPAFGSGPVATIAQDTITILVYFLVMTRLL
jgi:magnesium transporter